MARFTNTAMLSIRAAQLLEMAGRIAENELWECTPHTRQMIDKDIEDALRDLANWAGFDLVKREKKQEAA